MQKIRKAVVIILFTVVMTCLAIGVGKYDDSVQPSPIANLLLPGGTTISPWLNEEENVYYYFLPSYVDLSDTQLLINEGDNITVEGISFSDNAKLEGLSTDKQYIVESYNDKKQTVEFLKSQNVSTVFVSTATGSFESVLQSKERKEMARVEVIDQAGNVDIIKTDAHVKGRGNSTWTNCKKKPFSIIFNEPESVLGMGASSRWALLANAMDYSGIRNAIVFNTAKNVGLDTTPDYQYVELYLNGEYNGLYMLCQPAESFCERDDFDENEIYVFKSELPERLEDMNCPLYAEDGKALVDVCIPEKLHSDDKVQVDSIVAKLDSKINEGGEDIGEYIDIETWTKKYLIDEIFENYDSGLASSYFYTSTDGTDTKAYAGPIWDYDRILGNKHCLTGTTSNPVIMFANQEYRGKSQRVLWYSELYSNPVFYNEMVDTFEEEFIPIIESLVNNDITSMAKEISSAKGRDDIRWGIDSSEEYTEMIDYLVERQSFLEDVWLDGMNYVEITYSSRGAANDYMRAYVPEGSSLSDNPEVLERFNETDKWRIKGTSEVYDFDLPVNKNITLENPATVSGSSIKSKIVNSREELKLVITIGSIFSLWLLLPIYKISTRYKRGVR